MPTREYYRKNIEAQREYNRAYHARTKERRAEVQAASYRKHSVDVLRRKKIGDTALRLEVLAHYGGKCACCGENKIEFLALDHINGGGAQHRKELGLWGLPYYRWVRDNQYPDIHRVLCHNCNSSMGSYGYCPHVTQEVV